MQISFKQRAIAFVLVLVLILVPLNAQATNNAEAVSDEEIQKLVTEYMAQFQAVMQGLESLDDEVARLELTRKARLDKLKADLKDFRYGGTDYVGVDNTFYLTRKTGLTPYELNVTLEGTGLAGLGEAFFQAEQEFGVNSLFLIGIANLESGYGKSRIAKDKNNLFGFKAYDKSPYSSAGVYKTKGDSVLEVAAFLSKNYLSENGKFFHGVSTNGVNVKYSTSRSWSGKVEHQMERLANILARELEY